MGTQKTEWAFSTLWIAGGASIPTEEDDTMTEIRAFLGRQNGPQLPFCLFRVVALGKTQPGANADAVGITDDAAGYIVQIPQKKIGGFPSHARKRQ